jgi:hypothetical protein
MEKRREVCMMQVPLFRPSFSLPSWMRPGMGDCTKCKPCEENKKCIGYKPFQVGYREYEVVRR